MTTIPTAASDTLDAIERYFDQVPRLDARAERFGGLTLFAREGAGYPFYGRPRAGRLAEPTVRDVLAARARQRELSVPESFEWVAELAPTLRDACRRAGLTVHEHPLLVHAGGAPAAPEPPPGAEVRRLGTARGEVDPALPAAIAVQRLAFAHPGTAVRSGTATGAESDAMRRAVLADGTAARVAERIAEGRTVVYAALAAAGDPLPRPVCAGQYNPLGTVAEIVGVGTLPAARRRGLALAVTRALVADARAAGIRTLFLSAEDEEVARVYQRAGFRRRGTAVIAEPPRAG